MRLIAHEIGLGLPAAVLLAAGAWIAVLPDRRAAVSFKVAIILAAIALAGVGLLLLTYAFREG